LFDGAGRGASSRGGSARCPGGDGGDCRSGAAGRSALVSASIPAGSGQPKRSRRSADGGADERYPDQPASASLRWTGGSASGSAVSPTASATVGVASGSPGGGPPRTGLLGSSARLGARLCSVGSWAAGGRPVGSDASPRRRFRRVPVSRSSGPCDDISGSPPLSAPRHRRARTNRDARAVCRAQP
jgi:hypothetical protein